MTFEDELRLRIREIEIAVPGRPLDWDETVERVRRSRARRLAVARVAAVGVLAAGGVSGVAAMNRFDYPDVAGSPAARASLSVSIGGGTVPAPFSRATDTEGRAVPSVSKSCPGPRVVVPGNLQPAAGVTRRAPVEAPNRACVGGVRPTAAGKDRLGR